MAKKPVKKVVKPKAKKPVKKVVKPDVRSLVLNSLSGSASNNDKLDAILSVLDNSKYSNKVREVINSGLKKSRRIAQIQSL